MQRAVNTMEGEVFSVWFAYIHCGAMDVFSMSKSKLRYNRRSVGQSILE
jgi:hypothetical protein